MSEQAKHREGPRHRAPEPITDPANTATFDEILMGVPVKTSHRKDPVHHPIRNAALTAGAASGAIALAWGIANSGPPTDTVEQVARASSKAPQAEVQTSNIEIVAPDSPKVTTLAAPPPPKPAPVAAPVTPEPVAVAAAAPTPAPVVVEQAAPAPVADSAADVRAAIVAASYAQIGQTQDCVKMVADSLAAVGIYWYKWPVEYYGIGHAVSAAEAVPGDLIYYVNGMGASVAGMAHIAVYVGNGMAVHGGWNGNQTILYSVNVGSGPNYIRLNL